LAKTTSTKQAHLIGMQEAAKIRREANTDTTTLKNVINPTHRHAIIQEKTKKRLQQEKAQRKKDDKPRKANRRQQKRRNNMTLKTHQQQQNSTLQSFCVAQ
jgi:hypothetical protein